MHKILMSTAAAMALLATSALADEHAAVCPPYNTEEGRKASITADDDGNNCYGNPVVFSDPGRDAADRENAEKTDQK